MASFHIIGDQDTVLGYGFAGVTGDVVTTAEEAREAFQRQLSRKEQGVLLLTETVEAWLTEEVKAHRLSAQSPYLAVVRDLWSAPGKRRSLESMIAEAVGIRM